MQKLYVEYWVNSLKVYHNYFDYQFTLPVLRLHFTSRKIDIGIKRVTLSQNRIYNRRKFPLLPTYLELCFLIWEVNRKIIFQLFTTDRDLTLFSDFAWFVFANITYRKVYIMEIFISCNRSIGNHNVEKLFHRAITSWSDYCSTIIFNSFADYR